MNKDCSGRILVFLPTFNDLELLSELTHDISSLGKEYVPLVLDDGSRPVVDSETLAPRSLIFHLPTNFGIGVATHIAFDHALKHDYWAVVRIDADGQHPVGAIPTLIDRLRAEETDLVVGARQNRNHTIGIREIAARVARAYLSVTAKSVSGGGSPNDITSGFFAANRQTIETLNSVIFERFPEPQMYMLAPRRGLNILEVPIEQISREFGRSTITIGHAISIIYGFSIVVLAELLQGSKAK